MTKARSSPPRSYVLGIGVAVPLIIVCIALFYQWPDPGWEDQAVSPGPTVPKDSSISAPEIEEAEPFSLTDPTSKLLSRDGVNVADSTESPSATLVEVPPNAYPRGEDSASDESPETSPVIHLTQHPVLSGGRVEPILTVQGPAHVTALDFTIAYPGERVTLGSLQPVLKFPVMRISSQPQFGKQAVHLSFSEAVDIHRPTGIMSFRVNVSRQTPMGAVIPLSFLSAKATTSDGEEIEMRTEDGLIQVVADIHSPFDPKGIPTPTKNPTASDTGALTVATPDHEPPSPTPHEAPTPLRGRDLYVYPTQAYSGATIQVPVVVSDAAMLQGIQFRISYDSSLLQFKKASASEVFPGFYTFANPATGGGIIAMAGPDPSPMIGEAAICLLLFEVSPEVSPGTQIPIELSQVVLASSEGEVPVQTYPGFLSIVEMGTVENTTTDQKSKRGTTDPNHSRQLYPGGLLKTDRESTRGVNTRPGIRKPRKGAQGFSIHDLNFDREVNAHDLLLLVQFLRNQ